MRASVAILRQRHREPEDMDDPALRPEQLAHALKGLSRLNWVTGTAQVFWRHLRPIIRTRPAGPWRLLDVATGGGDIPLRLWRLARNEGFAVQIAGCDVNERGIKLAQARADAARATLRFFSQDVVRDEFSGEYDFVISSLFLHHLSDEESVRTLRKLAMITRHLLLVSDLRRSALGLGLAIVGTRVLKTSPVVRVDGGRSVRAAYTIPEIRALAANAGLGRATVFRHWPARWLLQWSPQ
jgi:2-polyprenyl-3-methyl-5-hydroxy-6-metoxy-1,4-benzoquinol methylase